MRRVAAGMGTGGLNPVRLFALTALLAAFPASAQTAAAGETPEMAIVERVARAIGGDGDGTEAAVLFHDDARFAVEREAPWSVAAFRAAVETRGCERRVLIGSPEEVADVSESVRQAWGETVPPVSGPALLAYCRRDPAPPRYDIYAVEFESDRIRQVRLIASVRVPPPIIVALPPPGPPRPAIPPSETLSAELGPAVSGYLGGLFIGNMDRAERFLADDVEVAVSDGTRALRTFPRGRMPVRAMYLAMTNERALSLENFSCRPEADHAICDLIVGRGDVSRHFTLRLFAADGLISRILSWENHGATDR